VNQLDSKETKAVAEQAASEKKVIIKRKTIPQLARSVLLQGLISYIIGWIIFMTYIAIDAVWGKVLIQAIQLFLLFVMLYSPMWYEGDRDSNFVQFGRVEYDKYRGVKVGLLACIPSYASILLMVIAKIFQSTGAGQVLYIIYSLLNIQFFGFLQLVNPEPYIINFQSIYFIVLMLFPLIYVAATTVGYSLGYKRISIMEKIKFKKAK